MGWKSGGCKAIANAKYKAFNLALQGREVRGPS